MDPWPGKVSSITQFDESAQSLHKFLIFEGLHVVHNEKSVT